MILETAGINNNGGGGYNIVVIQYLEANPTGILKYVRVKTSCTER